MVHRDVGSCIIRWTIHVQLDTEINGVRHHFHHGIEGHLHYAIVEHVNDAVGADSPCFAE